MKRVRFALFSLLVVLCGAFVLTGCGNLNDLNFIANKVVVQDTVVYDGEEHLLEVSYPGVEVTVTYATEIDGEYVDRLTFTEIGVYGVFYKLSAEGYNDYPLYAEFTILGESQITRTEDEAEVTYQYKSFEEAVRNAKHNDVIVLNKNIVLTSNVEINKHIKIGGNYTLTFDDCKAVITADGSLTAEDNAEVSIVVNYYEDFVSALNYVDRIILGRDILLQNAKSVVNIYAIQKDVNLIIDLNSHKINFGLLFDNIKPSEKNGYVGRKINVKITDNSTNKEGSIITEFNYGIAVFGDDNVKIEVSDITSCGYEGGIYSNGNNKNATINARNCIFEADPNGVDKTKNIGAYLPANHNYFFDRCTFKGATGLYTKSGNHSFTNCSFIATKEDHLDKEHNGNGANGTGSAFVVDSAQGYQTHMSILLNNCSFESAHGYGIEEFCTSKLGNAEVCYSTVLVSNCTYNTELGNFYSENNRVVVID